MDRLTLEVITGETLPAILRLAVSPRQEAYVATNAVSIAEAHFEPGAWFRAICYAGVPVGFIMLFDPTKPGAVPTDPVEQTDMVLWRLMIDQGSQRRGFGRMTLDAVRRQIPTMGHFTRLLSSFIPGPESPEPFYLGYGFKKTGRTWDRGTEVEIALDLVS